MISRLQGLPAGVIGFEASGKIAAEDYRASSFPTSSRPHATALFGWMTPTFPLDQKEQAIQWVAE